MQRDAVDYFLAMLVVFGTLAALAGGFWFWRRHADRKFEARLAAMPFPESCRRAVAPLAHYKALDAAERERLERRMLRLLHTLEFRGIGTEADEPIRALVVFYAALMGLHTPREHFTHLETVLVYAEGFLAEEYFEEGGIVSRGEAELDGQSSRETVVLSREDALHEAYADDAYNIIVHELAHVFDFETGEADGTPPMPPERLQAWHAAMQRGYEGLCDAVESGEGDPLDAPYDLLGEYAAYHPAEFFAVLSERFFQCPVRLERDFPELYAVLCECYGVDPRRWGVEAAVT